jgi:hypothetical protein
LENTIEDKLAKEMSKTNEILQDVLAMVKNHAVYINDSKKWRTVVVGIAVTLLLQVCGGLYLAGQITEKLSNVDKMTIRNETRLDEKEKEFKEFIREGRTYFRGNTNEPNNIMAH